MERIISIEEKSFNIKNDWDRYDGYIIKTDKQEIKVGISNGQSCCEDWGEFMSEDDLSTFIGSNLISIYVTDNALKSYDITINDLHDGDVMFVNFETSKGVIQFVAYNIHNGYYGHAAIVRSEQLNITETL